MPRTLTLLQPIPAADPLAQLFNDWLAGLAPVEQWTRPRPGRPDAENERTRAQLLDATTSLHGLHRNLTKAVAHLTEGAPLDKLTLLFRVVDSPRAAGIGAQQAESFQPLLDYVALQARMTSRRAFKQLLRYSTRHRNKLAEVAAEHPDIERTHGLFLAVFDALEETATDFLFLNPDDRIDLLNDLCGVLALECFEKVSA